MNAGTGQAPNAMVQKQIEHGVTACHRDASKWQTSIANMPQDLL